MLAAGRPAHHAVAAVAGVHVQALDPVTPISGRWSGVIVYCPACTAHTGGATLPHVAPEGAVRASATGLRVEQPQREAGIGLGTSTRCGSPRRLGGVREQQRRRRRPPAASGPSCPRRSSSAHPAGSPARPTAPPAAGAPSRTGSCDPGAARRPRPESGPQAITAAPADSGPSEVSRPGSRPPAVANPRPPSHPSTRPGAGSLQQAERDRPGSISPSAWPEARLRTSRAPRRTAPGLRRRSSSSTPSTPQPRCRSPAPAGRRPLLARGQPQVALCGACRGCSNPGRSPRRSPRTGADRAPHQPQLLPVLQLQPVAAGGDGGGERARRRPALHDHQLEPARAAKNAVAAPTMPLADHDQLGTAGWLGQDAARRGYARTPMPPRCSPPP